MGMATNNQPAAPEQLQLFFASRYLTIEHVATLLGVPKSFIYRRTARGHDDPIPHFRLGGHLRFRLDDVEAWVENHRNQPIDRGRIAAANKTPSRRTKRLIDPPGSHA